MIAPQAACTGAACADAREALEGLSHDLRSPLGALLSSAQLLGETGALTPDQRRHLERIERSALRMQLLIESIAEAFAPSTPVGRPRPERPRTIVRGALQLLRPIAEARGVALRSAVDSLLPSVRADRAGAVQALATLLAMTIEDCARDDTVVVMAHAGPGEVRFCVAGRDRGPLEACAGLRGQSGRRGWGARRIGLLAVRRIAERQGGVMSQNAAEGLWFSLPALPGARPSVTP
jgi:light-regulated signal transduction histidine kinase (bacteriophytochrome)